jgi:N-acetylglutamate synthase-like GNAT family acetyltransferase
VSYEIRHTDFLLSDDTSKLQLDVIYTYLSKESYWAQNIPLTTLKASIEGSCCFGVYQHDTQIGFARVITDKATFAYLADVFILEPYRGKGLSKQLMQFIMTAPYLQGLRRFMLATKDAQGLYKQFGFNALAAPERIMEIKFFESYLS